VCIYVCIMYLFMYVCIMYLCIYLCMCACMLYLYMHFCRYVFMYVYVLLFIYVFIYLCMYLYNVHGMNSDTEQNNNELHKDPFHCSPPNSTQYVPPITNHLTLNKSRHSHNFHTQQPAIIPSPVRAERSLHYTILFL